MRIVIASGGTAGHVNPAIALAEALRPDETIFIGTDRGAEARLVPGAGFPLETVPVRGLDRARPWTFPVTAAVALRAIARVRRILTRIRPQVVVGMGGYVSLPACLAARTLRTPVVLHEQNIVLGLANRVTKPLARAVAVSFPETCATVGAKAVHTGNPVLPRLAHLDRDQARAGGLRRFQLDETRRTLLVFGGSQGARTVNRAAVGIAHLWRDRSGEQILHITGRAAAEEVTATTGSLAEAALVYRAVPYVEDMGEAYAVADLALCRGGATTLAELQAVGLPSIIVPYPHHRDRQQELHGRSLERRGAAVVVSDESASAERISDIALSLLERPQDLAAMAAATRGGGGDTAAGALADLVRGAAA